MSARTRASARIMVWLGGCTACAAAFSIHAASAAPRDCGAGGQYARLVLADHPLAYFPLGDRPGAPLCDAAGFADAGSYASSGLRFGGAGPVAGTTSLESDGTVDPATSTTESGITPPQSFTLEGWFKATTKQDEVVVAIGQPGAHDMAGIGPWTTNGASTDAITWDMYEGIMSADAGQLGIDVYDGAWHYVAGSYDADTRTASLYLDGHVLISQQQADDPTPSPVRIGWWVDTLNNQPFKGSLAQVAVYPTALSADDVAAHYAAAAVPPPQTSGPSTIATSLPTPAQAFANAGAVAASAAVAVGGTLFITFPSQLFNLTFQENYAVIEGWFERLRRRVRRLLGVHRSRAAAAAVASDGAAERAADGAGWVAWRDELPAFALVVAAGAVLGGLLDPHFGAHWSSLETFVAVLLATVANAAVGAFVIERYHTRGRRPVARHLRALPLGLLIAAVCVLISRGVGFQPGYLYGVVCGIAFDRALTARESGHVASLSTVTVLCSSVIAWLVWTPVHVVAAHHGAFPLLVVLDDLLASVFVGGLVGSTIGLLPLRFLPGGTIKAWSTPVWAALFGLAAFGLVDLVIRSPISHHANHSPFVVTVVLFVAFAAASVGFREYFAYRWRVAHHRRLRGLRDFVDDLLTGHPGGDEEAVAMAGGAVTSVEEVLPPQPGGPPRVIDLRQEDQAVTTERSDRD